MKAIICNININSIRARVDGSIGATFTTPELTTEQKAYFFDLQNKNLTMTIAPLDEPYEEYKIDKDVEQKTQSQRIRAVLFLLWKQNSEEMSWEEYYRNKTEKYIEALKSRIEE